MNPTKWIKTDVPLLKASAKIAVRDAAWIAIKARIETGPSELYSCAITNYDAACKLLRLIVSEEEAIEFIEHTYQPYQFVKDITKPFAE